VNKRFTYKLGTYLLLDVAILYDRNANLEMTSANSLF